MATDDRQRLWIVKGIHTAVWVVVAGAIVGLYPAIVFDRPGWFAGLHVIILAEIVVLAAFRWSCPLTHIAARYTDDRRPNFDIFLPQVLASWNKVIFTAILIVAWSLAAWRWLT